MPLSPASTELGFFQSKSDRSGKYDPAAVGLAFSGGGYRASLFHTGAVLRLNELGILAKATRIASVSGGSITTGILAMNWDKIDWSSGIASHEDMTEHFVKPVMDACSKNIDVGIGFAGLLPGVSAGNALANMYDKHIFGYKKINTITNSRRFLFCAANLQTGGLVRFTRDYVADARAFFSTTNTIKLSEAVAASSGFPPVLAPIRMDLTGETVTIPEGARYDHIKLRTKPVLVDGGVYDNIGLEPIWKRCGILFASNAGRNNPPSTSRFVTGMMLRVVNTFLDVSVDWRERTLINMFQNQLADGKAERTGSYWTIATNPKNLAWDGWKPSDADLKKAADMGTRLKNFGTVTSHNAILAGYSYADGAIRKYVMPEADAPSAAPKLP